MPKWTRAGARKVRRSSLFAAKRDIVTCAGAVRQHVVHNIIYEKEELPMSFGIQHVHVKTRDPKQTMQFYIDNLGAQFVAEIPGRGYRVNLHGLTLNITTLISNQKHEQHYGIEHIALDTDDYSGTMARLKDNGVRILEEMLCVDRPEVPFT